jgi:membrane protease YdiL (CAAX protease family)
MQSITRQILTFLVFMTLLSAIPNILLMFVGRMNVGNGQAISVLMWCPALAAFITCALFKIDIRSLGWNFYPLKYEWISYLIPISYSLPVYLFTWLVIDGSLNTSSFVKTQSILWGLPSLPQFATWCIAIPVLLSVGFLREIISALGEEIGWRGFLLPRLNTRFGFSAACLISGLIWAMWHYLGILYFGYHGTTPKIYSLICFTLMAVEVSFVLGYIRLKTKSIWPCAILHASHNLFIQSIMDGMTAKGGLAAFIVGEFGAGLVITIGMMAIWLWYKRNALII